MYDSLHGLSFQKITICQLFFVRYMDRNFKLAPQGYPFQQEYIIWGNIGETASTLVYCLMESLEQAAWAYWTDLDKSAISEGLYLTWPNPCAQRFKDSFLKHQ